MTGLATVTDLSDRRPEPACTGLDAPQVLDRVPGLSYRQLDYWTRTERLQAHTHGSGEGSGIPHCWPLTEVEVASRMFRLIRLGLGLQAAGELARDEAALTAGAAVFLQLATEVARGTNAR